MVDDLQLPHCAKRSAFDSSEIEEIKLVLSSLYPRCKEFEVCSTYAKYSTLRVKGVVYGSCKSRAKNTSIVIAELEGETRPARIECFAKVSTVIDGTTTTIIMVYLSFFKSHSEKDVCGKPVTIWEYDLFDLCTVLQINVIKCRTVSLIDKLNDTTGNVLFVSPYY